MTTLTPKGLQVIEPYSIKLTVNFTDDKSRLFHDVGNIVEDPNTGSLTVKDRHGLPVATYAEKMWTSVHFHEYELPGDHVESPKPSASWGN